MQGAMLLVDTEPATTEDGSNWLRATDSTTTGTNTHTADITQ